jgi:hypothetical protein
MVSPLSPFLSVGNAEQIKPIAYSRKIPQVIRRARRTAPASGYTHAGQREVNQATITVQP